MSFIGFPVRLENGFLKRFDEPSAIVSLIEMMARTPHGSWGGSRHFGFRDYVQRSEGRPELARIALDELNRALLDLGIQKYKVESITRESAKGQESDVFSIHLSSSDGQTQVFRIESTE
jgi:hypothetical protein